MTQLINFLGTFVNNQIGHLNLTPSQAIKFASSLSNRTLLIAAGAFTLLGAMAIYKTAKCCSSRISPEKAEEARKNLDQGLDKALPVFISFGEQELPKKGKDYIAKSEAMLIKLGGDTKLPKEARKLQVLKTIRDNTAAISADIEIFTELANLEANIKACRSRKEFLEDLQRFADLKHEIPDADLAFREVIEAKLNEIQGLLSSSLYSSKGLNAGLDRLFTDIFVTDPKQATTLVKRKKELQVIFDAMVKEAGSNSEKYQAQSNKLKVLGIVIEQGKATVESQLFKNICVLQNRVPKEKEAAHFEKDSADFQKLVNSSGNPQFAFGSLITSRLREIQKALLASQFHPRNKSLEAL